MFGFRTPAKQPNTNAEQPSPVKAGTQTQNTNVRRSIGEWEAAKSDKPLVSPTPMAATQPGQAKTKQKQTLLQETKLTYRRTSTEAQASPPRQMKYANKTAEARACLNKAKLHLSNSRNLKTDIKTEVTQAIDRLYNLVKELEEEKKEKGGKVKAPERESEGEEKIGNSEVIARMEEHTRMLLDNGRKIDELRAALEEKSYASVTANKQTNSAPERKALHSVIVTSEEETDSGEEVLNKVREAIDAKEGWVEVTRVRKAKDRKIIMSCSSKEEREKVKDRLKSAGKRLIVEEVQNKDPLIILKDVLLSNSDEDVLKAMKNQNRAIFQDLNEEDVRMAVKYRRRARNPHTGHVIISTSPKIWRRAVDAGSLHIDLQHIRVADQSPLVQCSRCLGYGHSKRFCREPADLCCHCGGPHLKDKCEEWLTNGVPNCRNCVIAKLDETAHNAFSQECPVRRRRDALARMSIAYC